MRVVWRDEVLSKYSMIVGPSLDSVDSREYLILRRVILLIYNAM